MASYLDSSGVTYIFDVINNQWWNSKEATLPKTSFIIGDGQNSSAQKGALGVKSFGVSSVAAGKHSIAQGDYSFSMGEGNLSMGNKSTSLGGSFEVFEFSGEVNSTSYFTTIPNHYKEIVGAHVYMNETDDESSAIITAVSEGENGLVVELDKTLSDEGLVDQPIYINFNIARGESSFTHGSNIVSGDLDFATGYGNLSAGYSNFIAGEDNSVNGGLNAVFGANNHFIDENNYNNYVFGESNFVIPIPTNEEGESYTNFSNFVVGADNVVSGEGNKIFGYENTIEGDCFNNFVVGTLNDVYGDLNFVTGEGNIIEGSIMTSFGRQNETLLTMGTPLNGFMAGHNLQVQNDDVEIALGKWNKSNIADSESGRTLLSIGAGDEEERSNALEVMQNGDIYLGGHGSIYKLWDHKNKKTDFVTDLKTIEGNILEGVGDIDLESVTFKGFVDIESGTQGIDELAKSMRVGDVAMCMGTNATGGFGGRLSPDFFRIDDYTDEDLEKFRSENLLPLYFASEFAYMEGANNIIGRLMGAPVDPDTGETEDVVDWENLTTLSPMDVILVAKMDLNEVLGGGEEVPIEYEDVTNEVEFNEVDTLDHFKHIIGDAGGNVEEIILPSHFPEYMYVPNSKMSTPVRVGAFRYTYNMSTPNVLDEDGVTSLTDKDYIIRTCYDRRGRAVQSIAVNIGEVKSAPNDYGFNDYSTSSTISFGLTSSSIADLNDPEFLMKAMGVEVCYIGFSFVSRNDLIAIDDSVNSLPTETPDYSHSDGLADPDMIYNPIYHEQDVLIKSMDTPLVTTLTYQTVKMPEYVEQTGPAVFERTNSGSIYQEITGEEIPDDLNSELPKFIYIQTPDTYTHILNESTLSDWIGLETTDVLNMDDYIALSISRLDISKKPYMTQFIKIEDAEKYGFISYFEDDVKGHYLSDELIEKLYFDYNFLGGDAQVAINLAYIKSSEAVILDSYQETNFEGETYELYMGAIGETPAIHTEVYYKYLKPTASSLAAEIPVLFCKIIRTNVLEIFNYLAIAGDVLKVLFGSFEEGDLDFESILQLLISFFSTTTTLNWGELITSGSFMFGRDIMEILLDFQDYMNNGYLEDQFMNDKILELLSTTPIIPDQYRELLAMVYVYVSYFLPRLVDRLPMKLMNNISLGSYDDIMTFLGAGVDSPGNPGNSQDWSSWIGEFDYSLPNILTTLCNINDADQFSFNSLFEQAIGGMVASADTDTNRSFGIRLYFDIMGSEFIRWAPSVKWAIDEIQSLMAEDIKTYNNSDVLDDASQINLTYPSGYYALNTNGEFVGSYVYSDHGNIIRYTRAAALYTQLMIIMETYSEMMRDMLSGFGSLEEAHYAIVDELVTQAMQYLNDGPDIDAGFSLDDVGKIPPGLLMGIYSWADTAARIMFNDYAQMEMCLYICELSLPNEALQSYLQFIMAMNGILPGMPDVDDQAIIKFILDFSQNPENMACGMYTQKLYETYESDLRGLQNTWTTAERLVYVLPWVLLDNLSEEGLNNLLEQVHSMGCEIYENQIFYPWSNNNAPVYEALNYLSNYIVPDVRFEDELYGCPTKLATVTPTSEPTYTSIQEIISKEKPSYVNEISLITDDSKLPINVVDLGLENLKQIEIDFYDYKSDWSYLLNLYIDDNNNVSEIYLCGIGGDEHLAAYVSQNEDGTQYWTTDDEVINNYNNIFQNHNCNVDYIGFYYEYVDDEGNSSSEWRNNDFSDAEIEFIDSLISISSYTEEKTTLYIKDGINWEPACDLSIMEPTLVENIVDIL